MSTTAASEFHVMDLDAVLDEFESSQTLEAAVVATPPKTDPYVDADKNLLFKLFCVLFLLGI